MFFSCLPGLLRLLFFHLAEVLLNPKQIRISNVRMSEIKLLVDITF